jgi:hypothetical protein
VQLKLLIPGFIGKGSIIIGSMGLGSIMAGVKTSVAKLSPSAWPLIIPAARAKVITFLEWLNIQYPLCV